MEYRSEIRLLGLPLVHVSIGSGAVDRYRRGVATGWIAVGDVAFGVFFAAGGVAVGGLGIGGVAAGLVAFGGCSLGALALGGLAVGFLAVGGLAAGWHGAVGGFAVAKEYALGGLAFARHVLGPPVAKAWPWTSIPQAPFHWQDALTLALVCILLAALALAIQSRRSE